MTAGTVTNPTGSVKGVSVTDLIDVYTGNWSGFNDPIGTSRAQWQHVVLLTATADACVREGSGQPYASQEITIRVAMIGYADLPSSAPTLPPVGTVPLAFTANDWLTTSDGVHRVCQPWFMRASRNGNPGSDVGATAGTVTFTRMDAGGYEGSYDLWFGSDHATGAFVAPWCGTVPS